ncbi:MAG: sulfatase [Gemmataceae bacterium]
MSQRVICLFSIVFTLAAPSLAFCGGTKTKPNILIILADDLGFGDLSCQGAKDLQTPNIDKLFRAGMKFTKFYANSCVCSPTRAALLSGRYPELVGVPGVIRTHARHSWGHLTPDAVLLPSVLKRAGYHTALVGKWHLGLTKETHPNQKGFDFFHGFLGDMMNNYYTHRRHNINYMRKNTKTIDPKGHATDLFSQWASEYIQERAKKQQPFFLYLAYNAPHDPIQPPQDWLAKVTKRQPNISTKRAKLVALIEHMDHGIGQVIDALQRSGEYDNTIIIFTSDNGGALRFGANNGSLRDGKGSMYEGGLRVPMCAVWKGSIPRGSKNDQPALTMDLFPTACEFANAKFRHKIEGMSLVPLLLKKKKQLLARDMFFIRKEGGKYKGKNIYAMYRNDFTLVENLPNAKRELYNLNVDSRQKQDVRMGQVKVFREMDAALDAHIRRANMVPWQSPTRKGLQKGR